MKKSDPKPPAYLSQTAKKWWKSIIEEYVFESPDSVLILESVMQSFDRWMEAKSVVDKEGITITDRFGQVKQHPASLTERDARFAMLRGLKQLGLDVVPPGPNGRPPGR